MSSSDRVLPTDEQTQTALNCLLEDWYVASVLKKGNAEATVKEFKDQTACYPNLRKLARAKLDDLLDLDRQCLGRMEERCFVSHTQRQYLERVLHDKTKG